MSQADSARVEALEAQVKELSDRCDELEERVTHLIELAEGKDMMHEVYPGGTSAPKGRRSG